MMDDESDGQTTTTDDDFIMDDDDETSEEEEEELTVDGFTERLRVALVEMSWSISQNETIPVETRDQLEEKIYIIDAVISEFIQHYNQ